MKFPPVITRDELEDAIEACANKPVFACCSAGRGRWFWAAWRSSKHACAYEGDGRPFASGYQPTKEEAEAKGRAAAKATTPRRFPDFVQDSRGNLSPFRRQYGEILSQRLPAWHASYYRHRLASERRAEREG
jgi:hypothetical protein